MLLLSILLSAPLLIAVDLIGRRSTLPGPKVFWSCLAFMIGPVLLGLILWPVVLLALLLPGAWWTCRLALRGPSSFRRLSLAAAAVAFGIPAAEAYHAERGYARLRAR